MHLKFEVNGNRIQRTNIQVLASHSSTCSFTFDDFDWVPIEKYAIFWTKKGKSYVRYLGTGEECECSIPDEAFDQNVFSIQVWANDDLYTQKLTVGAIPDGYSISSTKNKKTYNNDDPEIILYRTFSQLESKIDNIKYQDGFLLCYSGNQLRCKTPIFRNLENEIQNNIKKLMPYFEVEDDGTFYVIYPYDRQGDN